MDIEMHEIPSDLWGRKATVECVLDPFHGLPCVVRECFILEGDGAWGAKVYVVDLPNGQRGTYERSRLILEG